MAGRKETAYFDQAERLYVVEGKTFTQIIEALLGQVSERSLSNWKEKGGWEEKRRQFMASQLDPLVVGRRLQASLLVAIEARQLAEDYDTATKLFDALGKLNATLRRMESQQYDKRAVCLESGRHLADWLKKKSPIKDDPGALAQQEKLLHRWFDDLEHE